MRTFIALELPENIKKEILRIQNELEKKDLFTGKFIEEKNLHLTLKFLGERSDETLNEVKKRLGTISFDKFEVKIDKLGVFSENFIRIVWVGLIGWELFNLQKEIDNNLSDLFEKEERFMAHVTIARPKFVRNKRQLIEEINKINVKNKQFVADTICLKESELERNSAVYSNLLVINGD